MSGNGQHIGAVSDSRDGSDDDGIGIARAAQAALKKLTRPTDRGIRRGVDYGDGDRCPADPSHGRMYVLVRSNGSKGQWCPAQPHDGAPHGETPTQSWFPVFLGGH